MPRPVPAPDSVSLAATIDHRALMLLDVAPMPFRDPAWGWEPKFDGFRMLAFRQGKTARLLTRNGNEIGQGFPEVLAALLAIDTDCVLDGELTVADERGRPDWNALRPRAAMSRPASIAAAAKAKPATFYAFDLLALGKRDLRPVSFALRRKTLIDLVKQTLPLRIPELWNDGVALLRAVTEHELEGVVGKRLDSPYVAGRSHFWQKVRASTAREQVRR